MDIIDEIRADREAGALRLEREYKPRLLAVAARFCPDETEAEALVYRTIDEAIRCIETLSDPNAFFGWMCGIMSNQYGKLNRRKIDGQIVYTDKMPEDVESDGAESVVQAVDATLLREAVEGLPDKLREAVVLRYFADMPILQIARFLTIPVGTVNSRLYLARMALSMRLGAKLKKPIVAMIVAALFLAASAAMLEGIAALLGGDAPPPTGETPASPEMISIPSQGEEQMKTNTAKSALLGIAAAALAGTANAAPAVSHAGVKYWDNPDFKAFDVGDYVQDGLVLNYDGIRNQGAAAPHDSTATTWVNLGSAGADYNLEKKGNSTASAMWSRFGFVFDGKTFFGSSSKTTLPSAYEFESLVDAKHSEATDIGYVYFLTFTDPRSSGDAGWQRSSLAVRKKGTTFDQTVNGTTYKATLVFNTHCFTAFRPALLDESFTYLTALANNTYSCVFTGLNEPAGAPGRSGLGTGRTQIGDNTSSYIHLGGHGADNNNSATSEGIVGTIKNVRYYSRALSTAERTWNRVVDEARYFGRRAAIPVTNVVVACAIDGVPDSHFALDAEGYTFTAPASRTVKGYRYVLNGYKLETWNGSDWGAPALHDGETSCTLSNTSGKVRLTWQYARPEGEGYLVVYDIEDYVQDGLEWHYDGIRNVGANAEHNPDTTTWVNLGSGGSARDLTPYKWRDGDQGEWDVDGYAFKGNSVWQFLSVPYTAPATFTMQTLIDASTAQGQVSNFPYIYSGSYNKFGLALWAPTSFCYANSQGEDRENMPRFTHSSRRYDYATTILDGSNDTMATFDGTTAPTSGDYTTGFREFDSAVQSYALNDFRIGGFGADTGSLVGKIKSLRFYPNKVLSTAELEQNRRVDEWRFFHRPPVTNVVVASTRAFLHGNESEGPWQVSGSYTFTAPASVTDRGITYEPAGYTIETWNGGEWSAPVACTGASYAYSTSAGLVRLTWQWKATHGLRTAADYDVQDYVADGLVVNYDGIRNVGASASHDSSATKWANLGSGGSTYDLTRYSLTNSAWSANGSAGSWADDGFVFAKNAVFHEWSRFVAPKQYTIQTLVDAKTSDQNGIGYIMCDYNAAEWWKSAIGVRSSDSIANTFYFVATFIPTATERPAIVGITQTYATTMLNGADAVIFAGTSAPWNAPSTGGATGHYKNTTKTQGASAFNNGYSIGGHYPRTDELFKGTLKNYRFYDRVLTDEEVAWNRNVDSARYFGELATTNVLVVAGGGTQTETGAYKVEGEWTFTATTTLDKSGKTVNVERYSVETLVNGEWKNKNTYNGNSYTYTEGTSPATVRLQWLGSPLGMIICIK